MNDYQIVEYLQSCGLSNGTSLGHHSGSMDFIADRFVEVLNQNERRRIEIIILNKKVEELSEVLSDSIKIKAKEIKSEAIKEFVERLKKAKKNSTMDSRICTVEMIDNLVKEMVGENNV